MKSRKLVQLHQLDKNLRKNSLANYREFLRVVCATVDHDAFRVALQLLKAESYDGLINHADCLSSTVYSTAAEHRLCNQLASLIRKYPFPSRLISFDARKKATETFLSTERFCARKNRWFRLLETLRNPYESEFSQFRNYISYVLGPLRLSDVWSECGWGPGASLGVHGNATNMARKFLASRWSVSPSAFHYAYAAACNDHNFHELLNSRGDQYFAVDNFELYRSMKSRAAFVDYNKITFVPKTARTERTIAVEPLLNGYLQKGLDLVMRKRLKRVGLDLDDQSLNQELARRGSIDSDDPYVTIDLSAASDSISTGLCRHILPPDWFDFMNSTRSGSYLLNGEKSPYNKFVTMGNGFCFPLETLIFASACNAAYSAHRRKPDFSVYGDDIIVRSSVADTTLRYLRMMGFRANTEKTFLSGPFRESCGADWFNGIDVRPITLKYEFSSTENIFKFLNLVRRKADIYPIFLEASEFLLSLVPPSLRFMRPVVGQIDTAIEVDYDAFMTSRHSYWNSNLQCWEWLEIVKGAWPDTSVRHREGYSVALIRGAVTGSKSNAPFTVRRRSSTKIRRVAYSSTTSLDPWRGYERSEAARVLKSFAY